MSLELQGAGAEYMYSQRALQEGQAASTEVRYVFLREGERKARHKKKPSGATHCTAVLKTMSHLQSDPVLLHLCTLCVQVGNFHFVRRLFLGKRRGKRWNPSSTMQPTVSDQTNISSYVVAIISFCWHMFLLGCYLSCIVSLLPKFFDAFYA